MASAFARLGERLLDAASFSSELHRLRRELNARIDAPEAAAGDSLAHPLGGTRWFKSRRISIAEAYVRVVKDLDSRHAKFRLRALRRIVEVSFHTLSLDMPLNTARVQLALVKEAVKHRGDQRKQLELLHDFSQSSHGQYQTIRRLLGELNMIELPEKGLKLRDLDAGWDGNVHDSSTTGRKNATQLLIDAFIKGISELTIACGGPSALEQMAEAVEAGRIVGIRVRLGIEFSLTRCDRRFHFMALLPAMERGSELGRFFRDNRKVLKELVEGLEENQESRVASIKRLLENFNEAWLGQLNAGFPRSKPYRLPRLKMRNLARFVPLSRVTRDHLGDFLHAAMEPVLLDRVLLLKVRRARAARETAKGLMPAEDFKVIDGEYRRARAEYIALSPEALRRRYFATPAASDYTTVFDDLERMRGLLREAGCGVRVLHPLEHGLEKAIEFLEGTRGLIDEVEIFNIKESLLRDPGDLAALCAKVNELNAAARAAEYPPIMPLCGSDATGRSPDVPGMGFVFADCVGGRRAAARYARRHVSLPPAVALLVRGRGAPVDLEATSGAPALFSMGKISAPHPNRIGDEPEGGIGKIPIASFFRYLNPLLLDFFRVGIGFLVARSFIGDGYALLWLGITGFRNTMADLIAAKGGRLREWSVRSVNIDNVARSLFWTGFSVPILGFVKAHFDQFWPFATVGLGYNAVKFFFLSGANGLYIASHNKLRGFDRSVIRANLFRSVLSWPFATVFAPLGNLIGLPSIVQTKIWSDVVAGFIEGGGKYFKIMRLRHRDLEEIIPRLTAGAKAERFGAILDLLYLWREEPRTRTSLELIVAKPAGAAKKAEAEGGGKEGAKPKPSDDPREILRATFSQDRLDRRLLDFIVGEYRREVAVDLAELVANTLPELRDWISAKPKRILPILAPKPKGEGPSR
jgi:hypothetical protein